MICVLYVTAVGLLLGICGLLLERSLPASMARRWIWCLTIPASLAVPGFYKSHHSTLVSEIPDSPFLPMRAGWLTRLGSHDALIGNVWFAISLVLLAWTVAHAGWVSHVVHASRRMRHTSRELDVVDSIPVVVTRTLGPATVGVWHARVLLPAWVLTLPGIERRYIVRHEEEHRRANDGRLRFLASMLVIIMPWNVALWWQLRRLSLAIEVDCDRRVVRALGDARRYGELLLKVALAASSATRLHRLQPALLGGMGMLERRLSVLLAPVALRTARRCELVVLAALLLATVLAMPHPVMRAAHPHGVLSAHHMAAR